LLNVHYPRLAAAILHGPNAIIELRKQTPIAAEILPTFRECIQKIYQGRMRVTEQLQISEWATVGSFGNDSLSVITPAYYRLQTPPEVNPITSAYN
jgi:hypothetical protein